MDGNLVGGGGNANLSELQKHPLFQKAAKKAEDKERSGQPSTDEKSTIEETTNRGHTWKSTPPKKDLKNYPAPRTINNTYDEPTINKKDMKFLLGVLNEVYGKPTPPARKKTQSVANDVLQPSLPKLPKNLYGAPDLPPLPHEKEEEHEEFVEPELQNVFDYEQIGDTPVNEAETGSAEEATPSAVELRNRHMNKLNTKLEPKREKIDELKAAIKDSKDNNLKRLSPSDALQVINSINEKMRAAKEDLFLESSVDQATQELAKMVGAGNITQEEAESIVIDLAGELEKVEEEIDSLTREAEGIQQEAFQPLERKRASTERQIKRLEGRKRLSKEQEAKLEKLTNQEQQLSFVKFAVSATSDVMDGIESKIGETLGQAPKRKLSDTLIEKYLPRARSQSAPVETAKRPQIKPETQEKINKEVKELETYLNKIQRGKKLRAKRNGKLVSVKSRGKETGKSKAARDVAENLISRLETLNRLASGQGMTKKNKTKITELREKLQNNTRFQNTLKLDESLNDRFEKTDLSNLRTQEDIQERLRRGTF